MAKAEQIIQLLKSYQAGDDSRFYAIAMQVAAHEARKGHSKIASEIKELIDLAKKNKRQNNVISISQSSSIIQSLVVETKPKCKLSDLTFSDVQKDLFQRVLQEFSQQEKLNKYNLKARRKLLLTGPPGTGKTFTASAFASELKLPLYTVRLDSLITKYMGETASKLRQIFEFMRTAPGVYLFDEFDAIGSDRLTPNDTGEIRRVLNSFLQFLEEDNSESLIVCATNYKKLLDTALFRRFDDLIVYDLPERNQIKKLITNQLHLFDTDTLIWEKIEVEAIGLSHAEISRACDDAAKKSIFKATETIDTSNLVSMLKLRQQSKIK